MDESIRREQSGWDSPGAVQFYRTHRNQPENMYPSERFFLPSVLQQVTKVLDVGCAAGGFSRIMRSFNPNLRYTGVDISEELLAVARQENPDCDFFLGDGVHFSFPPGSFDLVYCTGILHVNSQWKKMIRAMWELCNKFLLFDVRLTQDSSTAGSLSLDYGDGLPSHQNLPYQVFNTQEWISFIRTLTPRPSRMQVRGYPHPVSEMAVLPIDQVIMAFCLLTKGTTQDAQEEVNFDTTS